MIPFSDFTTHHQGRPVVNIALIILNALVFLYALAIGGFGYLTGGSNLGIVDFYYTWGFIPLELTSGEAFRTLGTGFGSQVNVATPAPTWATIFFGMFMHGGLLHFAGNMVYLWVFGDNIEARMGHIKYLLFYLLVGVIATLRHWFFFQQSDTPLIGASGAISGVLGAYLMFFPYNRVKVVVIFFLITAANLPALYVLGFYMLLQVIQLVTSIGVSDQVSVAIWAHIGGFVAGAGIVAAYKLLTRQPIWPSRYDSQPSSPTQFWRGRPLD
ncbi:MAG: rhomboid family intramembrane serine protease [Chloroflexi bacterium]|nr:rhomboid family intramembrane serine protease [Chloroflexota bacterium]